MPRTSSIISISLPTKLSRLIDKYAKKNAQTRSELMRDAVREYIADMEDQKRFEEAYKETRNQKTISLKQVRKKYNLK